MNYQDVCVSHLPDAYAKDSESNNYKLFRCITPEYDFLLSAMKELDNSLDVDYAYGGTLDKIGTNVNQSRGSTSDVVLRTLIKAKIAADMSEGTIETLLDIVNFIFGSTDNGGAQIIELFNYEDESQQEPAAFRIAAPIEEVIAAGISLGQFVQLMVHMKAAGVKVYAELQGTFEFGEIGEYGTEIETGFANEEQTAGGTLSTMYDPTDDIPLPI